MRERTEAKRKRHHVPISASINQKNISLCDKTNGLLIFIQPQIMFSGNDAVHPHRFCAQWVHIGLRPRERERLKARDSMHWLFPMRILSIIPALIVN